MDTDTLAQSQAALACGSHNDLEMKKELTLLPLSCMPDKSSRLTKSWTSSGRRGTFHAWMGVGKCPNFTLLSGKGARSLPACEWLSKRHKTKRSSAFWAFTHLSMMEVHKAFRTRTWPWKYHSSTESLYSLKHIQPHCTSTVYDFPSASFVSTAVSETWLEIVWSPSNNKI